MMRNPIYVGRVESRDSGVSTKGDFEPLVEEATFYRAQAVLDGRIVVTGPRQRNHPDFLAARLRFFSITSSSLTGDEAASLILSAVRVMSRLCRQHTKGGFIAKISRGPDVKIIEKGHR